MIRREASVADTTQGIPSSRLTITAWLMMAPTSTTTASAARNNGVHAGSVSGATSTSPGSQTPRVAGVGDHPGPTTGRSPGQPGSPVRAVAGGQLVGHLGVAALPLVQRGLGGRSKKNGGYALGQPGGAAPAARR